MNSRSIISEKVFKLLMVPHNSLWERVQLSVLSP
jgi:hypothetical protein